METTTVSTMKVYYPSSPVFAFNRIMVLVKGVDTENSVTFNIGAWDTSGNGFYADSEIYKDTRQADASGNVEINISRYVQLLFTSTEIEGSTPLTIGVTVQGTDTEGSSVSTTVTFSVYWGCVSAGERIKGRTVRYFTGLNNPISYWLLKGSTVLEQIVGGTATQTGTVSTTHIETIDLSGKSFVRYLITQILEGATNWSTFDETFDYTFWLYDSDDLFKTEIIADCNTDGVYLKWIDDTGMWNYYLFKEGSKTHTTKDIGDSYETFFMSDNVHGYYGATRPQGKTHTVKQEVCAPGVSIQERQMLQTILSSPLVYWCPDTAKLANGDTDVEWIPVTVAAGNITETTTELDDFTISVNYPDTQAQRL